MFLNPYGQQMTRGGFKSTWQRGMVEYAAAGFESFSERDLRAKAGLDSSSLERR
jgi:hypothetical protein